MKRSQTTAPSLQPHPTHSHRHLLAKSPLRAVSERPVTTAALVAQPRAVFPVWRFCSHLGVYVGVGRARISAVGTSEKLKTTFYCLAAPHSGKVSPLRTKLSRVLNCEDLNREKCSHNPQLGLGCNDSLPSVVEPICPPLALTQVPHRVPWDRQGRDQIRERSLQKVTPASCFARGTWELQRQRSV